MKVVIAGSRNVTEPELIHRALLGFAFTGKITEVVSGCCIGADILGEKWAIANDIPIKRFSADWTKHGKAAGIIRNAEMADYADAAVIVWDGKSPGSRNMIEQMNKRKKPYLVYIKEFEK